MVIRTCSAYRCRACGSDLARGDSLLCDPCGRDLIGAVVTQQVIDEADADLAAEDARLYGGPAS